MTLSCDTQFVWRRDAASWFQSCRPATENALEPAKDDTSGWHVVYCPPTADALFPTCGVESGKDAKGVTVVSQETTQSVDYVHRVSEKKTSTHIIGYK